MLARIALAALAAASFALSAQGQTTLRMAYVAPPSAWGPIADRYAQHVAEKTGGQIKIQGVGGGQLGSLPQNYAGLKTGQIDMMLADVGTLGIARGGKDMNALFAPYTFEDHAHFRRFIDSQVFRDMLAAAEREAGFKYLGYLSDRTPRQITTAKTRVTKPEDLKGLKIRVPETATIYEVFKTWGAAPTPVAAAELYLALKQGIVDGQDNGFDAVAGLKLHEVQKYMVRIDYIQSGLLALIAADKWAKLTPEQQKAMIDAVPETERWASKMTADGVEQAKELIRKGGMEIVEPDLGPFRKTAAEVIAKLDGQLWSKGTLEKIRSVK